MTEVNAHDLSLDWQWCHQGLLRAITELLTVVRQETGGAQHVPKKEEFRPSPDLVLIAVHVPCVRHAGGELLGLLEPQSSLGRRQARARAHTVRRIDVQPMAAGRQNVIRLLDLMQPEVA